MDGEPGHLNLFLIDTCISRFWCQDVYFIELAVTDLTGMDRSIDLNVFSRGNILQLQFPLSSISLAACKADASSACVLVQNWCLLRCTISLNSLQTN